MKIHNFFPLSIFIDQINLNQQEKDIMINEIMDMEKNSQNPNHKLKGASWTGDTQGFEYLYKNKKFEKLFEKIKEKIDLYLDFLHVNKEKLDIFMMRAWATISNKEEAIHKHQHLQSHLSFAYYLKKSPNDSKFILHDEEKKNEFIPNLFNSNSLLQKQYVKKITFPTASTVAFDAKEDDILIFPSKTHHSTENKKNNSNRISISGDIIFLAKESNLLEYLTPHYNNWKQL